MKWTRVSHLAIACACLAVGPLVAQHEYVGGEPEKLGKVDFSTSCDPAARSQFNHAVALLHSFWYDKAAETFAAAAKTDPACSIAYWGVAMTHNHPLWEAPGPVELERGWAAVEKAKSAGAKTQRERDYVAAIETFYKDFDKLNHSTRALGYEKEMEQVYERYPKDREAAIFYALAVRGNAPPGDKPYANQKKAGAILEQIFAEQPEHPGVAHYIIHCYDYPPLAERALEAARRYAKIAPDSPHALHMPSHIFTLLGLWQESVASNRASAAAARKHAALGDELHAMDYLVYAYLQQGRDREARELFQALPPVRQDDQQYFAGLYAMAAMPARYAVERHRWREAAALSVPPNVFPRGRYSWTEANLHFARALGAARTGNREDARKELEQLSSLHNILTQANEKYWAEQVEIQRETVAAWLALAEGKREQALREMRSAADHEDKTDKHAVTPGVILPARELLGEMLLELKQPAQALAEFAAVLRVAPNRWNALAGAALAAKASGDREKAKRFYTDLMAQGDAGGEDRPEIREAKLFLRQK